jgi:hypothetical protein
LLQIFLLSDGKSFESSVSYIIIYFLQDTHVKITDKRLKLSNETRKNEVTTERNFPGDRPSKH